MTATPVRLDALGQLATHPLAAVLIALLLAACVIDWRTRRIPNWLTGLGAAYAIVVAAWLAPSVLDGMSSALLGLAVGLAIPMPLYVMRVTGAGDVKLMAMVGAFLGPHAAWQAVLASFIAGGVCVVLYALSQRALGRLVVNTRELVYVSVMPGFGRWQPSETSPSLGRFPYAASIGIGTTAYLVLRQLAAS